MRSTLALLLLSVLWVGLLVGCGSDNDSPRVVPQTSGASTSTSGCTGGASGSTSTGTATTGTTTAGTTTAGSTTSGSSVPQTATVVVHSDVSRSGAAVSRANGKTEVPIAATDLRFSGTDANGQVAFGPVTFSKAPVIIVPNVPLTVTTFEIEYLQNGNVIATYQQAVNLTAGGVFLVDDPTIHIVIATLNSITVKPDQPVAGRGTALAFTALGNFSDGTTQDVTQQVTWSSSDQSIATISNNSGSQGVAQCIAGGGPITISATLSGLSGTATLSVLDPPPRPGIQSIIVTPGEADNPALAKGTTLQFSATGIFADGSTADITSEVLWESSSSNLTISNTTGSRGQAFGAAVGGAKVTALLDFASTSVDVNVTNATLQSISVTPPDSTIAMGSTQDMVATGTFSDGSTQTLTTSVVWSSTVTAEATISNTSPNQGRVTPVAPGGTTIKAVFSGITGTTTISITPAALTNIIITPVPALTVNSSVAVGQSQRFQAQGIYADASSQDLTQAVTWSVSFTNGGAGAIASGGSDAGTFYASAAGNFTVTAQLGTVSQTLSRSISNVVRNVLYTVDDAANLREWNLSTNNIVNNNPLGGTAGKARFLEYDPPANRLYMSTSIGGDISVNTYDTGGRQLLSNFQIAASGTLTDMAYDAANHLLYLAYGAGGVTALDVQTLTVRWTQALDGAPDGLAVDVPHSTLYVAEVHTGTPELWVLNAATGTGSKTSINIGSVRHRMHVDASAQQLFVSANDRFTVVDVSGATPTLSSTVLGSYVDSCVSSVDGRVFLAVNPDGTHYRDDAMTNRTTPTVTNGTAFAGQLHRGMYYSPSKNRLYVNLGSPYYGFGPPLDTNPFSTPANTNIQDTNITDLVVQE